MRVCPSSDDVRNFAPFADLVLREENHGWREFWEPLVKAHYGFSVEELAYMADMAETDDQMVGIACGPGDDPDPASGTTPVPSPASGGCPVPRQVPTFMAEDVAGLTSNSCIRTEEAATHPLPLQVTMVNNKPRRVGNMTDNF